MMTKLVECEMCGGWGYQRTKQDNFMGAFYQYDKHQACEGCNGEGEVEVDPDDENEV